MFTNTGMYSGSPGGFLLHSAGLSGVGVLGDPAASVDDYGPLYAAPDQSYTAATPQASDPATPWYLDRATITAANSELLYGINLWRGINNQAPLAASQYAPQVAVGLNSQTQNLVVFGLIGLGAVLLMKGKRGGKRRR